MDLGSPKYLSGVGTIPSATIYLHKAHLIRFSEPSVGGTPLSCVGQNKLSVSHWFTTLG